MEDSKNHPTMIIPQGTEIAVNEQGQLSIRTPGNLVIQNSGVYSVIESGSGSVRIDPNVQVEAISVEAADSCFVAGELTAWRVHADKIILEKGAQANIMLQESADPRARPERPPRRELRLREGALLDAREIQPAAAGPPRWALRR